MEIVCEGTRFAFRWMKKIRKGRGKVWEKLRLRNVKLMVYA